MTEQRNTTSWEKSMIEKMLLETIKEQRRSRRWKIFFRSTLLVIFLGALAVIFSGPTSISESHVALIEIKGLILDDTKNSAYNVNKSLNTAFQDKNVKGIIINLNSGGGSAVQASNIYDEIVRLREKYPDTKVVATCSDVCASGAYYIASAANDIYANEASLVGSIGVLMSGFGFVDTLEKLGVQRRLMVSGNEKGFLDPFLPEKVNDKEHMQTILDIVHEKFISDVKSGRGARLSENQPDLFSGLIWTGKQSLALGLIDGFGDVNTVTREVFKLKDVVDYSAGNPLLKRLTDNIGSSMTHHITENLLQGSSIMALQQSK